MKWLWTWTVIVLLMAGCANVPTLPGCVEIGPYGQFCPLPPRALPTVDATHLVVLTHDGQTHHFLGRLRINDTELRLAASSLLGTHLFTLSYNGHRSRIQPQIDKLHPDLFVAVLEVALASPEQLKPQLHGMTLEVSRTKQSEVRDLFEYGHLVAHIERTGERIDSAVFKIEIAPAKLTLKLTPMENTL